MDKRGSQRKQEQEAQDELDSEVEKAARTMQNHDKDRWSEPSGSKNLDWQYHMDMLDREFSDQFICIFDPLNVNDEDDEDYEDFYEEPFKPEDALPRGKCDTGERYPCDVPASSMPHHDATVSVAGLAKYHIAIDMLKLGHPEIATLHTFKCHHSYGALEVVQNLMLDFDEALRAKDWHRTWAIIEAMGLLIKTAGGDGMLYCDDEPIIRKNVHQVLRMMCTAFGMLDKVGLTRKDSEIMTLAGW